MPSLWQYALAQGISVSAIPAAGPRARGGAGAQAVSVTLMLI